MSYKTIYRKLGVFFIVLNCHFILYPPLAYSINGAALSLVWLLFYASIMILRTTNIYTYKTI